MNTKKHVNMDGEPKCFDGVTYTLMSCCDCGLTHLELRQIEKDHLTIRYYRDAYETIEERKRMSTNEIEWLIKKFRKELRRRKK